jgi:hypothetical protein
VKFIKKSLLVFCLLLGVFSFAALQTPFAATEEVEISGIVYASTWDSDGNVTSVVIATEDGEEIAVSNSAGKGIELQRHEGANIIAFGMLVTDETGSKSMTVVRYVVQE